MGLRYLCDEARHLICLPYTVENLHRMAAELGLKRCWFHASSRFPHYDIPKRRIDEVVARCTLVSSRDILRIIRGTYSHGEPRQRGPEALDDPQKRRCDPSRGG